MNPGYNPRRGNARRFILCMYGASLAKEPRPRQTTPLSPNGLVINEPSSHDAARKKSRRSERVASWSSDTGSLRILERTERIRQHAGLMSGSSLLDSGCATWLPTHFQGVRCGRLQIDSDPNPSSHGAGHSHFPPFCCNRWSPELEAMITKTARVRSNITHLDQECPAFQVMP